MPGKLPGALASTKDEGVRLAGTRNVRTCGSQLATGVSVPSDQDSSRGTSREPAARGQVEDWTWDERCDSGQLFGRRPTGEPVRGGYRRAGSSLFSSAASRSVERLGYQTLINDVLAQHVGKDVA